MVRIESLNRLPTKEMGGKSDASYFDKLIQPNKLFENLQNFQPYVQFNLFVVSNLIFLFVKEKINLNRSSVYIFPNHLPRRSTTLTDHLTV